MKNRNLFISGIFSVICALSLTMIVTGCGDAFEFELPEAGSLIDEELPTAAFSAGQSVIDWKQYDFVNTSTESIIFEWDFGDGGTSQKRNPMHVYEAGEGTYTVTLRSSDANGESATVSQDITVVMPPPDAVLDPILVNPDFDKLAKESGSDCSCAGWINKSIGEQGESSTGNDNDVVKFDNNEPDHVYQEFAVVANADYKMTILTSFKASEMLSFPSSLEIRMLAGTGYDDGYTPVYYTDTAEMPQDGWGYSSIAQVEDPANNLLVKVQDNPEDTGYISYEYTFNSGANSSVALFIRGIGGEATGDFGYTGGDEEIRADFVLIEAND